MGTNFKKSYNYSAIQKKIYGRICIKCNNRFETFCKHGTTCSKCWQSVLSNKNKFFPKIETINPEEEVQE